MRAARILASLAGIAGLAAAVTAAAGAISVAPIRIALSARHPIATMEVRNEGAETITVQLERMAWTQQDGRDVYSPSAALIATPSVFEIGPHASQVLRIALRDATSSSRERAFRLYVVEVPAAESGAGSGLQMALRIGVPIFAESEDGGLQLGGALVGAPGGALELRLRNGGGHFTRAVGLALTNSSGDVLWKTRSSAYLLAGGEYRWPIESAVDSAVPPAGDSLHLSVTTETGVETIDVQRAP